MFDESAPDSLKTWTLGIRWDVLPNLALKAEVSALEGDEVSNSFLSSLRMLALTEKLIFILLA
ncbi:hypothetical protein ACOBV9_00210 [Pseudoalteromonas espejiana]